MHFVIRDRMLFVGRLYKYRKWHMFDGVEQERETREGESRNCEDEIKKSLKYK